MKRLFTQFSFPGGIPSHVAPETPGLDPRGRRAGLLALARLRRRLRQSRPHRRLRRRRRRGGDRPAGDELALEQVPQPGTDGAVLPILHLNGYKIANPTVLARISHEELERPPSAATATRPYFVEGDDPATMHHLMAADARHDPGRDPPDPERRAPRWRERRPRWPMIVLRTPKGGPVPKEIDGKQRRTPGARIKCRWVRCTKPRAPAAPRRVDEELPAGGALRRDRPAQGRAGASCAPRGSRRMSANPHANGGLLLRDLQHARLPRLRRGGDRTRRRHRRGHARPWGVPAGRDEAQHGGAKLPHLRPRREHLEPLAGRVRGHQAAPGWRRSRPRTTTWLPTAASWKCSANITARAGSKATCSPAATASSPATRPSSTSSTRCSTSTPSG